MAAKDSKESIAGDSCSVFLILLLSSAHTGSITYCKIGVLNTWRKRRVEWDTHQSDYDVISGQFLSVIHPG